MSANGSGAVVLIPLVDLFSNILMLFMANNPVFNSRTVNLPKWSGQLAGQQAIARGHQLEITRAGQVLWDRDECSSSRLEHLLRRAAATGESVSFRMDSAGPFETFWRCFETYSRCGFKQPPRLVVSGSKAKPVGGTPSQRG